jgi:hypothetical protein
MFTNSPDLLQQSRHNRVTVFAIGEKKRCRQNSRAETDDIQIKSQAPRQLIADAGDHQFAVPIISAAP